jgi:transcription factor IIIB subunit 2
VQLYNVAKTALHLVSRMRADWINTGRRPAGICGACLLLAARVHGFHRTRAQVIEN